MRKFYNEYFHIPENGILCEKVFFTRLAVSVVCIVLCLAALGFNAYAFFSTEVTSSMNVIKSANYDLDIAVTKDGEPDTTIQPTIPVVSEGETNTVIPGAKMYVLETGTYNFVLKWQEGSASNGYARIHVGDDPEPLYTEQIGTAKSETKSIEKERTVIICLKTKATVWITPCWGTYAGTDSDKDLITAGYTLVYQNTTLSKTNGSTTEQRNSSESQAASAVSEEDVTTNTTQTSSDTSTETETEETTSTQQETTTPTTESNETGVTPVSE